MGTSVDKRRIKHEGVAAGRKRVCSAHLRAGGCLQRLLLSLAGERRGPLSQSRVCSAHGGLQAGGLHGLATVVRERGLARVDREFGGRVCVDRLRYVCGMVWQLYARFLCTDVSSTKASSQHMLSLRGVRQSIIIECCELQCAGFLLHGSVKYSHMLL